MSDTPPPAFLAGGGEMGALMRSHDWAAHPLGVPAQWPSLLKSTLRLLLTSNHPMFIWWGDELHQFYNDAYRRTMGAEHHPADLGQRGRECWAEAWPVIGPQIDDVMAGRGASWHENALVPMSRHGNREDVYWTYGCSPIEDEERVHGVLALCTDVTGEVRLREKLKQSYVTVIDSMDEGLAVIQIIVDDAGLPVDYRFLEVNPAFERQTGLVGAIGRTARELVPGLEERWFQIYGKVALTGESVRFMEGSEPMNRWFDVYAIRVGPAEEKKVALMFRDVSERTRTEQALRDADRRKDEFLAMLAHELRNPLAPISAAANLLQLASTDPARVKQASAVIGRQVRHISGLIDDLLDVSRVTRGMIPLVKVRTDVKRVVADAIEQLRPLIENRGHRLRVETRAASALVLGDPKRLVQVVANLLNNAAKYTPHGGDIALELDVEDDQVILSVTDNGIGMTARVLEHAFELFVQAERETDRAQGGLGIGLALVKSLVGLHGGEVFASSDGLGLGSRFTICLPHLPEQEERSPVHAEASRERGAGWRALRVMVVDDNVDAAEMLAMLLETTGHQVAIEHHALQVVNRAQACVPDVFLLDIGLPDLDGYALARQIRAAPELAGAVLIAITGYGDEQARQEASAAGFDHHFVKPIETARLLALLDTLALA
ncbi:ATP-binding protein [Janthinobacterium sp. PC23-8]|uniref:hybrid sensor histidine kinase/response regulator n=1 Tax=Janthinobacterium sp. PC23-8 TaxID=2012679 RepID=UPI0011407A9E|nr:ATP-binding protein [Janthinobacterium sp. PC23-8]